jgi:DNA-binding response OmpR family regulator
MMNYPVRLLVVEDDADLAFGLRLNLEVEGYQVILATDGVEAADAFDSQAPHAVILDLMLPDVPGFDLLQRWRRANTETPIIILSAKDTEANRVASLRLGADDFVGKPFSLLELMERIKLHVRRGHQPPQRARSVAIGDAMVDFEGRFIRRSGRVFGLTPKELELLRALLDSKGAVLSKETILRDVWHHRTKLQTNTLEFHITSLRRKIEVDPHRPKHLLTVRKAGCRLQAGEHTGD